MNFQDEILKILTGLAVTGICSVLYKLFQWLDKTDARLHDIDRDLAHMKRNNLGLATTVASLDDKGEKIISGFRRTIYSVSGRISRVETRVYVVENRLSDSLTQAIAKQQKEIMSERN